MTQEQHTVSTFALDVYFAGGAPRDPALERHVRSCERCATYLAQLERLASHQPPAAWAQPRTRARSRSGAGWLVSGALVAGALVGFLLFVPARKTEYVASKGVPAVQALIRSQGKTRIWDGRTALRAGDAIALQVGCDHYTHVAVLVASASATFARWFDARCSELSRSQPLPFTLLADDKPGMERIAVLFTQQRLDDAALLEAAQRTERSRAVWVNQLVLKKVQP